MAVLVDDLDLQRIITLATHARYLALDGHHTVWELDEGPSMTGGGRGIRTPGAVRLNGFQDRRNRPLCHPSAAQRIGGDLWPLGRR